MTVFTRSHLDDLAKSLLTHTHRDQESVPFPDDPYAPGRIHDFWDEVQKFGSQGMWADGAAMEKDALRGGNAAIEIALDYIKIVMKYFHPLD